MHAKRTTRPAHASSFPFFLNAPVKPRFRKPDSAAVLRLHRQHEFPVFLFGKNSVSKQLVKNPQRAANRPALLNRGFSQPPVAGQQRDSSKFRDGQRERVIRRQLGATAADFFRVIEFLRRNLHRLQAELDKLVSPALRRQPFVLKRVAAHQIRAIQPKRKRQRVDRGRINPYIRVAADVLHCASYACTMRSNSS